MAVQVSTKSCLILAQIRTSCHLFDEQMLENSRKNMLAEEMTKTCILGGLRAKEFFDFPKSAVFAVPKSPALVLTFPLTFLDYI